MFRRHLLPVFFALLLAACTGSDDPDPDVQQTPDAGVSVDVDASEPLPFMSPCETDEQCESGLCYPYNAAGPHCTHACESDLDCEDPSPGCNGKGVCKRPH